MYAKSKSKSNLEINPNFSLFLMDFFVEKNDLDEINKNKRNIIF